jgi:hypothetical protein
MKNGEKRRAWTSVQVRELKTMARTKRPAADSSYKSPPLTCAGIFVIRMGF